MIEAHRKNMLTMNHTKRRSLGDDSFRTDEPNVQLGAWQNNLLTQIHRENEKKPLKAKGGSLEWTNAHASRIRW